MKKVKIEINAEKLNTKERREKASLVEEEMQIVVNSDAFKMIFRKKLITRAYWNGEQSKWSECSPTEIIAHFYTGWEVLNPNNDQIFQIEIDDYYTLKRVIGYTKRNISTVFVNTRYFDKRTSKLCGSNIVHERGHKIGFGHDFYNTARRKDSLCYLLNEVYEEAYDTLFKGPCAFEKVLVCKRKWIFFKSCEWRSLC